MTTSSTSKTVIRGTGITAILNVTSRALGFIRDLLVARLFGAGLVADAYIAAYRIPNLLRSFIAEGALTSAFVPVFSSELEKGQEAARKAIREVSGFLLLVTTALTLIGIIFAAQIVHLIVPGFQTDPEKGALCAKLTAIMFPYIICVSFIALVNGALNAVHIYGASGIAQVVMNIVLIAGAILAGYFDERGAAMVLALSVLVGGGAQIVAQIPALRRAGFSIVPSRAAFSATTREVVKLMLPATIGAGIYQTGIFLNTLFASFLAAGSVSWLYYADRVTQLPVGVFTIALASVLLPVLSRARAGGNEQDFGDSLVNSLRYTSFVIIPVVVFLYLFADPLVVLLFQRGAFSAADAERTAAAVRALLLGIWAVSCHSMVARAFIARKDTVTPTVLGALSLLLNAWLSLQLMGPVASAAPGRIDEIVAFAQRSVAITSLQGNFGHVGLALASSLSSTAVFLVLSGIALRRYRWIDPGQFLSATFRGILAGAAMALAITALGLPAAGSTTAIVIRIAEGVVVAALVYGGVSVLLRSAEAKETFSAFLRLLKRALNR